MIISNAAQAVQQVDLYEIRLVLNVTERLRKHDNSVTLQQKT
jgi:hypothetical protein